MGSGNLAAPTLDSIPERCDSPRRSSFYLRYYVNPRQDGQFIACKVEARTVALLFVRGASTFFSNSATGEFKFFCSTHGAVDAGMHGTVTVVP